MRYKGIAVLWLIVVSTSAQGRQVEDQALKVRRSRVELRSIGGWYLPQGEQRRDFQAAPSTGIQLAMQVTGSILVVASGSSTDGWSKLAAVSDVPFTRMLQYDIGLEFNTVQTLGAELRLRPFFGVGAGTRNYHYPQKGISSAAYPSGYYSLGAEVRWGFIGFRAEGRNYLSAFRAPMDPALYFRDDSFATIGLVYHL